jgi:hypothetical protein
MSIKSLYKLCGFLFLLTIALFIVGNMIMKNPLHDTQNFANTFQLVKENTAQYRVGNFLALMGVTAQFALMITLYQILKAANPFFALLALGWRIGEQVILTVGIIASFLILGLSQSATLPGNEIAEYLGQILVSIPLHVEDIAFMFLGIASVFNNWLFYKSKTIPTWLALLGLIGAALYALGSALPMLGLSVAFKNLTLPLLLFEILIGFYLTFWPLQVDLAESA